MERSQLERQKLPAIVRRARRCRGISDRRAGQALRSGGEVRPQGERRAVPAQCRRPATLRAHLPAGRHGTLPDGPRPARRRLDAQGPLRGGTDGPRGRRERRSGGGDRHDPLRRSAVPGEHPGRELRPALDEVQGRRMARRPIERRHLRQLHRRPHRHPARHAPARLALQRHPARRRNEHRRQRRLRRLALADHGPVHALPAGRKDEARHPHRRRASATSTRGNPSTRPTRSKSSSAASP